MLETIIMITTTIVTYILGLFAKKSTFIKNELIPLQNLIVGVVAALIYWFITKDFSMAIMSVGLFTGGTYDLFHNLKKIIE